MSEKIEDLGGRAGVKVLGAALTQAVTDGEWFVESLNRNWDTAMCLWSGQHSDGRKHKIEGGRDAFPWEGASDTRIRTADEIVNDEVKAMKAAFRRAKVQAVGLESTDTEWGEKVNALIKWMIWGRMRGQLRRELELAATWRQCFGLGITNVMWDYQTRQQERPVDFNTIVAMFGEDWLQEKGQPYPEEAAAELLAYTMEQFQNPALDKQSIFTLKRLSPLIDTAQAKKMLGELRETQQTTALYPEMFDATVRWTALMPFVDVFFPTSTGDLQRSPWVASREKITETDLRDRVNTYGYDESWVDEAVKLKGRTLRPGGTWNLRSEGFRNPDRFTDDDRDLIEIYHFYYKAIDKRTGVPVVWCKVMHPSIAESFAKEEVLPYSHGMYPYIEHVREYKSRSLLESRGVAELIATQQYEIKVQRDARVDRTQIATIPPVLVPNTRGAGRLPFGPGVQWPRRRGEDVEWFKGPPFDQGSIEIERSTEKSVDRYFGRISEHNDPSRTIMYQQDLIDDWLMEQTRCVTMSVQLMQQYMDPQVVFRIAGGMKRPFNVSKEEIQGQFDVMIEFDARDMNPEFMKQKLEMYQNLLMPLDKFGILNVNKIVQIAARAVDPWMADEVIQDVQSASFKEVEAEQDAFAKIMSGQEPPLPEGAGGVNPQLRLQVLQQALANPEVVQTLQQRPLAQQMLEARMKAWNHQIQQSQNAQIGRVGARPVMGNPIAAI